MSIKNLCVYCGSNKGRSPDYIDQAQQFAQELVKRDIRLVYGGSIVGIMGVMADLLLKKELAHRNLTELHIVSSMHERKAMIIEKADGFVALPSGAGTLEEIFETWTWAQLGMHQKPCSLLNIAGYYDALGQFLDRTVEEEFIRLQHRTMLIIENNPAVLLNRFADYMPPSVSKWITSTEQT
jgi:uncharacterized protein (TIGR00730 family)